MKSQLLKLPPIAPNPEPETQTTKADERVGELASKESVERLAASMCTPKGLAMMGLLPESAAARSMLEAGAHDGLKELDIMSLLVKQSHLPEGERIASWERLAESQAKTLDCLFHRLVALGFANIQKEHFQPLLKMAFRAQAQSARTLETLATLRQPTLFTKQINIAQKQVVANGVSYQDGGGGPAAAAVQATAASANADLEPPVLASDRGGLDALTNITRAKIVQ